MKAMKTAATAGLAAAAVLASIGAALAYPAVSTGSVNVRSGPGTGYAVRDSLRAGERVDVQKCQGSWCYVSHPGPDGWVSANYLSRGGRTAPRVYVTPQYDDSYDDDYYYNYDYGPSIYVGPSYPYGYGYPRHHRPHNWHPGDHNGPRPGQPGGNQGQPPVGGNQTGGHPHRPHGNPDGGMMQPPQGGQIGNPGNGGNAGGGHPNVCQENPELCMGGGMGRRHH